MLCIYIVCLFYQIKQTRKTMNAIELKNRIEAETGLKISVKNGKGSELGYVIFTVKSNKNFEYEYPRNLIKEFPECDIKPAFANNYQIGIYHGITR